MLKARATHAEKDVVNNFVKIIVGRIKKSCNFAAQKINGVLAQLVERLNGIQKVRSSILLCSTKKGRDIVPTFCFYCGFTFAFKEFEMIVFSSAIFSSL